jgi:hypothetical protein
MKAKFFFNLLILLLSTLLLSSCSLLSNKKSELSQHQVLSKLLPVPQSLLNSVVLDHFTINKLIPDSTKAQQTMLIQTEFSATGISLAAMTPHGVPLAEFQWNSSQNQLSSNINLAHQFDPSQVIYDLQSIHWPIEKISSALKKGYSVEETINGEVKLRQFYSQNSPSNRQLVILIRQQNKHTHFEHHLLGYQLSITQLQSTPLNTANLINE